MAGLAQVQVECIADGALAASGNCQDSVGCIYFVTVTFSGGFNAFQSDILYRTEAPFDDLPGGFDGHILTYAAAGCQYEKQQRDSGQAFQCFHSVWIIIFSI